MYTITTAPTNEMNHIYIYIYCDTGYCNKGECRVCGVTFWIRLFQANVKQLLFCFKNNTVLLSGKK